MYYEVFIPSPEPEGFDVTITVDAENWMEALKSGLERTGEGADAVRNVMCDIKDDNTIHVTDATSQRVFVLNELSEDEYREAKQKTEPGEQDEGGVPEANTDSEPAVSEFVQQEPMDSESVDPQLEEESQADEEQQEEPAPEADEAADDEDRMRVGSSSQEALRRETKDPRVVDERRSKTDPERAAGIGRKDEKISETLIEDVFLEIQEIHEGEMEMEEVVDFVLDMATDKVGSESGSILFADVSGTELYFAAARGPKADEIMDFRVPMGKGIAGFCAREGVSLAIGDAQHDPRFYEDISEALGYETDALLCAPIQYEGRVYGVVELVNKEGDSTFSTNEMNVLSYIGRQLAQYVNRTIMNRESIEDE